MLCTWARAILGLSLKLDALQAVGHGHQAFDLGAALRLQSARQALDLLGHGLVEVGVAGRRGFLRLRGLLGQKSLGQGAQRADAHAFLAVHDQEGVGMGGMGKHEADRLAHGEGGVQGQGRAEHEAADRPLGLAVGHGLLHGCAVHQAVDGPVFLGDGEGAGSGTLGE